MKHYYQIITILAGFVFCIKALVHFEKLEKGEDGCKTKDGAELKVGETVKDPLTCGVFVCQNKDGDALIHYCQKPASFESCYGSGVSTITPWPECCWKCVRFVACGEPAASRTADAIDARTDLSDASNEADGDKATKDTKDSPKKKKSKKD